MTVMNGNREIKIVLLIRKLIKEHKKYINYRVQDEGFLVFMIFNYYYAIMKRLHPKAQVWEPRVFLYLILTYICSLYKENFLCIYF